MATASALRGVPPVTGKRPETVLLTATLALHGVGCTVPEIGALVVAAELDAYVDADDERTARRLALARQDKHVVASAERVLTAIGIVPAIVPATTQNGPGSTPRQPQTQRKTR